MVWNKGHSMSLAQRNKLSVIAKNRYTDARNHPAYQHGMSDSRIHKIWKRIKTRCYNKNTSDYKYYGGRGVRVCDRWLIFKNFYEDIRKDYDKHVSLHGENNTTIDRIDTNKDYCKNNCRFATRKQQTLNRRITIYLKYDGRLINIASLSEITGIGYNTLYMRWRAGWPIKDIPLKKMYSKNIKKTYARRNKKNPSQDGVHKATDQRP